MSTNYIFIRALVRNLSEYGFSTRTVQCIRSLATIVTDSSDERKLPNTLQNKKPLETGDTVSVRKLVTVNDVDAFCNLTGDFNTIHTQSRIVHGALLNGLVSGVMGSVLPGPGCMVASQTLNYPKPCVAPVTLTVTVSVTSARKIVRCDFDCRTAEGIVVLHGDARLVMRNVAPPS